MRIRTSVTARRPPGPAPMPVALDTGANVDGLDHQGNSPMAAVESGDLRTVAPLLTSGADTTAGAEVDTALTLALMHGLETVRR